MGLQDWGVEEALSKSTYSAGQQYYPALPASWVPSKHPKMFQTMSGVGISIGALPVRPGVGEKVQVTLQWL